MKTASIRQSVTVNASPQAIYKVFMNARKHSTLTNSEVTMTKKIRGQFSIFDGYCSGYNMELKENRKIVQAWHFQEEGWPEDHFSICSFLLTEKEGKTRLSFTQTDIPAHKAEDLKQGWKRYYWEPLKTMFK